MDIILYYNSSENNKIGKVLSNDETLEGSLKDATNVINPEVMVRADGVDGYNYAYIPLFNRYYFVEEVTSFRTGLWIIKLQVDVLETFKSDILSLNAIIDSTEAYMGDNYLPSESWVTKVKTKTDILNFSNGLLDSGEYILITAGG